MATNQKKNSGSGKSRSNSSKKSSNSRSTSSKSKSNSRGNSRSSRSNGSAGDGLTRFLLILLIVLVIIMIISNWKKGKEQENTPTPTPVEQLTPTTEPEATPTTEAFGGTADVTPTPLPTQGADATPTPTPVAEPEATPTISVDAPEAEVSIAEADGLMAKVVNVNGYSYEMSDDHLWVDGRVYYCYVVVYQEVEEKYAILVAQDNGEMYYYDTNGNRTPLTKFPMDSVETPQQGSTGSIGDTELGLTVSQAKEWLSDVSFTRLALPAPLAECTLSLDDWKTMVNGVECYCLNVFYNNALAGTIYFTENAAQIYYLDEFGEFIPVR